MLADTLNPNNFIITKATPRSKLHRSTIKHQNAWSSSKDYDASVSNIKGGLVMITTPNMLTKQIQKVEGFSGSFKM